MSVEDDFDDFDDDLDEGYGLIEVGKRLEGGRTTTRLVRWSSGRIGASVGTDGILLRRLWGRTAEGDSLDLSWEEVRALRTACLHWGANHHGWRSTYEQAHRGSGPFGPIWSPPEARWKKPEVELALASPIEISAALGVRAEAEIVTPSQSGRHGLVYSLTGGLRLRALVGEAQILRRGTILWLEGGEEALVSELAALEKR